LKKNVSKRTHRLKKDLTTRYRKTTIVVTIKRRIVRIKGDKKRAFSFDFPTFKITESRAGTTQAALIESVSLRG